MAWSRGEKIAGIGAGATVLAAGAALSVLYLDRGKAATSPPTGGSTPSNLAVTSVGLAAYHVGGVRRAALRAAYLAQISGVTPVSPAYGQHVVAHVTISNSGQQAGNYSIEGYLVLSGAGPGGTAEGHLGLLGGSTVSAVTGTISGGGSTSAALESGPIAYAQTIGGYTSAGLDLYITLTNTGSGVASTYFIPGAVFLPSESPSSLGISAVTLGVE